MKLQERRAFIRLQAYHCVKYRILSEVSVDQNKELTIASIKDIGAGGVCIKTEERLPIGALIELKINFPRIVTSIYAIARVVWVKQLDKLRRYEIGMQFTKIEDTLRKIVDAEIKGVYESIKREKDILRALERG